MTATRMVRVATLAAAIALWCVCAYLLGRTTRPVAAPVGSRPASVLQRARAAARGAASAAASDAIFLLATVAKLVALAVLAWRLPRSVRAIGLGRIVDGGGRRPWSS